MQQKTLEFDITPDCAGARLDRCLSRLIPGSSRAYLQKLIKDGLVRNASGESITLPRYPVKAKEHIVVLMPEMEDTAVKAEEFDYPILFEDEHMLVIAIQTEPSSTPCWDVTPVSESVSKTSTADPVSFTAWIKTPPAVWS